MSSPDQGLDVWTWGSLHFQAFAYRSTDGGRTWSEPVNIDGTSSLGPDGQPSESHIEGNMDLTETSAVQMPDGSILALIRSGYSPWMWETSSDDGGRTWQPCVRGPFAGYNTSNLLRTECGAILVGHRLPELTIHISRDDGDTWDQGTTIDSGVGAGGRMIEVEPNVVLYVYFASWGTLRAQIFRVTPAGLEPAMT